MTQLISNSEMVQWVEASNSLLEIVWQYYPIQVQGLSGISKIKKLSNKLKKSREINKKKKSRRDLKKKERSFYQQGKIKNLRNN